MIFLTILIGSIRRACLVELFNIKSQSSAIIQIKTMNSNVKLNLRRASSSHMNYEQFFGKKTVIFS